MTTNQRICNEDNLASAFDVPATTESESSYQPPFAASIDVKAIEHLRCDGDGLFTVWDMHGTSFLCHVGNLRQSGMENDAIEDSKRRFFEVRTKARQFQEWMKSHEVPIIQKVQCLKDRNYVFDTAFEEMKLFCLLSLKKKRGWLGFSSQGEERMLREKIIQLWDATRKTLKRKRNVDDV